MNRLVKTVTNGNRVAKIYKTEDEYIVKLFVNDNHQQDADYFTDDREDAAGTAAHMVKSKSVSESVVRSALTSLLIEGFKRSMKESFEGPHTITNELDLPNDFIEYTADVDVTHVSADGEYDTGTTWVEDVTFEIEHLRVVDGEGEIFHVAPGTPEYQAIEDDIHTQLVQKASDEWSPTGRNRYIRGQQRYQSGHSVR